MLLTDNVPFGLPNLCKLVIIWTLYLLTLFYVIRNKQQQTQCSHKYSYNSSPILHPRPSWFDTWCFGHGTHRNDPTIFRGHAVVPFNGALIPIIRQINDMKGTRKLLFDQLVVLGWASFRVCTSSVLVSFSIQIKYQWSPKNLAVWVLLTGHVASNLVIFSVDSSKSNQHRTMHEMKTPTLEYVPPATNVFRHLPFTFQEAL